MILRRVAKRDLYNSLKIEQLWEPKESETVT